MDALNFAKQIPSWLDQELFDKAIRSYQNDPQAKVKSFEIEAATAPGNNFASAVFRAAIKFTSKYQKDEKKMSVIIKTQPVSVDLPNMEHMTDTTLFRTEMDMFSKVLTHIQELVASVGYDDVMCPKLIYQTMTPKPIIILEDVNSLGFDTMITTHHDDFEATKMVVQRLAKFHAAGFYLHDEQKIDASHFDECLYKHDNFVDMMFGKSYEQIVKLLSESDDLKRYENVIRQFKDGCVKRCLKTYSPSQGPGAFNVLNHGDFHMKNLLYKMKGESGEIKDFIMLDFQISVYASPAVDLTYVLINFMSDENRFTRYDEMLAVYHKQFVESLTRFGYLKQPPSLLDLQIEMMRNGHLFAQLILLMYPFLIFDLTSLTAEDMAAGPEGMFVKTFADKRYQKVLKESLAKFLVKGYLGN